MPLTSVTLIGRDRSLSIEEAQASSQDHLDGVWRTYVDHFERFTGAMLDPQFSRLENPARSFAVPLVSRGCTVVIVGSGPSLAAEARTLARLRRHVSVWTSLRGAEAMAAQRLQPDLIIVQHASDLDAYLTTRHLQDRNGETPLTSAPVVLAEPRTPAALLRSVPCSRLAAVDPAIGWGLWPATMASLAITAGASAVGLLGIDLGTPRRADPAHIPLVALLARIAERAQDVATLDLGTGAAKCGWMPCALRDAVGSAVVTPVQLAHAPWASEADRYGALTRALVDIATPLHSAAECRAIAMALRDGRAGRAAEPRLEDLWRTLLAWRWDARLRLAIQEELGARFLPRFWRQDAEDVVGPLWRPALLAADELVSQAQAASARVEQFRMGTAA